MLRTTALTLALLLLGAASASAKANNRSSMSAPARTALRKAYMVLDGNSSSPPWWAMFSVATGRTEPPKGFRPSDFRVPTLAHVLRALPRTPINVEIKGRTPYEATGEYVRNAEVLARLLRRTSRRDLIVASFQQPAVDRFHELLPRIDVAPGIAGAANRVLAGGSPGEGVAAFQVPITYRLSGTLLEVTTADNVAPRTPRGLRLAELVLGRRPRRARDLAPADRHVRRRHHDLALARPRARAALARPPRRLRVDPPPG